MKHETNIREIITLTVAAWLVLSCLYPAISFAGDISAEAAIVINTNNREVLYAKNAVLRMYPASTTKLMTAIVVCEKLQPDAILTVSEKAAATPSVAPQLMAGERYAARDLLYLALMRSVNSAAVVLAEGVSGTESAFAGLMNKRLAGIGVKDTRFINASGLPGEGQFVTAYDLAIIMQRALNIPLLREIMCTRVKVIHSQAGRCIFVKSTNQLLWTDESILGGKTGYTRAARHCFVSAARQGSIEMIIAVLGVPKREDLWNETLALLHKGIEIAAFEEKRSNEDRQFTNVSFKTGR